MFVVLFIRYNISDHGRVSTITAIGIGEYFEIKVFFSIKSCEILQVEKKREKYRYRIEEQHIEILF